MNDTKYATYQQHEPLRIPSGWGAQEKRLISQLEEILDDLYRRFNRLKMTDLGEELQDTIKTSKAAIDVLEDTIQAVVASSDAAGVSNNSIIINTEGIYMTGGVIDMQAGASLNINSAGNLYVAGATGSLVLGEGSQISATQGSFSTLIIAGELYKKIVYSTTRPNGSGFYWAFPEESVTSVELTYQNPTSAYDRSQADWIFSDTVYQWVGGTANYRFGVVGYPHVHTIPASSTVLAATSIKYTFKYPIYAVSYSSYYPELNALYPYDTYFYLTVSRGATTIQFMPAAVTIEADKMVWVEVELTSATNLFTSELSNLPLIVTSYLSPFPNYRSSAYFYAMTPSETLITFTAQVAGVYRPVVPVKLYYLE